MDTSKVVITVDIFDDRQNGLLWQAALIIYSVMREHDDLERVSRIASGWSHLTGDEHEVFPPLLMERTQSAVTDRLITIANRAFCGMRLCPELDGWTVRP
jgi:hypothetical protein